MTTTIDDVILIGSGMVPGEKGDMLTIKVCVPDTFLALHRQTLTYEFVKVIDDFVAERKPK